MHQALHARLIHARGELLNSVCSHTVMPIPNKNTPRETAAIRWYIRTIPCKEHIVFPLAAVEAHLEATWLPDVSRTKLTPFSPCSCDTSRNCVSCHAAEFCGVPVCFATAMQFIAPQGGMERSHRSLQPENKCNKSRLQHPPSLELSLIHISEPTRPY